MWFCSLDTFIVPQNWAEQTPKKLQYVWFSSLFPMCVCVMAENHGWKILFRKTLAGEK